MRPWLAQGVEGAASPNAERGMRAPLVVALLLDVTATGEDAPHHPLPLFVTVNSFRNYRQKSRAHLVNPKPRDVRARPRERCTLQAVEDEQKI